MNGNEPLKKITNSKFSTLIEKMLGECYHGIRQRVLISKSDVFNSISAFLL